MRSSAETLTPDLFVIGAGSGGLSVAAGAAQMGATVVLAEGGRMGGDCLNFGCVPSKALIAAAKKAHIHRTSTAFGVAGHEPEIDYAAAMRHVHGAIAAIAPHDSVERFEGLGVTVLQDYARFLSASEAIAGGQVIRPRRFVIATGSSPAVPPIPGLDTVPYLTNETLWENVILPDRLIVIGGGPIGIEMAQAHARLGSEVVVLEAFKLLGKDDPEITAIALARLREEGVDLREGANVAKVSADAGVITVALEDGTNIVGTHLLVATGRTPNIGRLDLDAGEIAHDKRGIKVKDNLRSRTNSKVYAIGDVAGGLQFTHVAGYHAGLVVRSALFRLPVAAQSRHIPWVTYTDPEIAHIGLTEAEVRETKGDAAEIYRFPFAGNDRAQAERETDGLIKLMACNRGKIHGVSIVGPNAGDLIQVWALALSKGLRVKDIAGYVAPYPTMGEVSKRVAGAYFARRLFESKWIKRVVRLLARLG